MERYLLVQSQSSSEFTSRVNRMMDQGYEPHGAPIHYGEKTYSMFAQAMVLPKELVDQSEEDGKDGDKDGSDKSRP